MANLRRETREKARAMLRELTKDDQTTDFSTALPLIRKMLGLTQEEYGKKMGVALLTIKQIETGQGNPTIKTLDKLFGAFGFEVCLRKKQ